MTITKLSRPAAYARPQPDSDRGVQQEDPRRRDWPLHQIGASFLAAAHETKQLVDAIVPVVDALGFEVDAINVDCKIVDGHVNIFEINPRLVDDQMSRHMIEIATGLIPRMQSWTSHVADRFTGRSLRTVARLFID